MYSDGTVYPTKIVKIAFRGPQLLFYGPPEILGGCGLPSLDNDTSKMIRAGLEYWNRYCNLCEVVSHQRKTIYFGVWAIQLLKPFVLKCYMYWVGSVTQNLEAQICTMSQRANANACSTIHRTIHVNNLNAQILCTCCAPVCRPECSSSMLSTHLPVQLLVCV